MPTIENQLEDLITAVDELTDAISVKKQVLFDTEANVTLAAENIQGLADELLPISEELVPLLQEVKEASDTAIYYSAQTSGFADVAVDSAERAEEAALALNSAMTMTQHAIIADANQTVLLTDTEGREVRAYGGKAHVEVHGLGGLVPAVDYSISSEGIITLASPLRFGDLVKVTVFPRFNDSETQSIINDVTGAADRAETAANRAENAAEDITSGTVLTQQYFLATEGQIVVVNDSTGTPITAVGGKAMVVLQGIGTLTQGVDYNVNPSTNVISFVEPLAEGDLVTIITFPRITNAAAQVILDEFAERVSEDADRAASYGSLIKKSIAELQNDTVMTSANTPVGTAISILGVGDYIRVASNGEIKNANDLFFTKLEQNEPVTSLQLGLHLLTDCRSSIINALQKYGCVRLVAGKERVNYPISSMLNIPNGTRLELDDNACLMLASTGSNRSSIVVQLNDDSAIVGGIIDGNHSNRITNDTHTGSTLGGQFIGQRSIFNPKRIIGVGSGTGEEVGLESGGGIQAHLNTVSATKDVCYNKAYGFILEAGNSGFPLRIHSSIRGTQESDCSYYVHNNHFYDITIYGGLKNASEIAGPNTRYNTVSDVKLINPLPKCTTAFEMDYGAYRNKYERCVVEFTTDITVDGTFNVLSCRGGETQDGFIKYTRNNVFEDCGIIGGTWDTRINIMVQRDYAQDTTFIRTFSRDVKKGSATTRTDLRIAYYEESHLGNVSGVEIKDVDIEMCDIFIRRWGSKITESISVMGGKATVLYRTLYDSNASGGYIRKLNLGGGLILDQKGIGIRAEQTYYVNIDGVEFRGSQENPVRIPYIIDELGGAVLRFANNFINCPDLISNSIIGGSGGGKEGYVIEGGGNVYLTKSVPFVLRGDYGRCHIEGSSYTNKPFIDGGFYYRGVSQARMFHSAVPIVANTSYWQGDEVYNSNPIVGSPRGWVCVSSGTNGTLSDITCSGVIGEKTLTVNTVGSLSAGKFITIGGSSNPYYITTIQGTTLTLETALVASYTDVTVSYRAPIWSSMGNI